MTDQNHSTSFQWPRNIGIPGGGLQKFLNGKLPWTSKEFKLAFFSALGIGLITHLYVFSNLLLNWDSAEAAIARNGNLGGGRWSLEFFSSFSTRYQLPLVIGLLSIAMIALTAGLTVQILSLSHSAAIVSVSALLVTWPVVAATFAYMFTADAYFIALFMNTLAVWLTKRFRLGFLPAAVLIAVACGCYQAYICYAIGLFLFDCILALLEGDDLRFVLRKGVKYVLVLILGLVIYTLILRLLLALHHVTLLSYQGMDTMAGLNLGAMMGSIPAAFKEFIWFYAHWPCFPSFLRLAQIGFPLLFSVSLVYVVLKRKLFREPVRIVLLIVGVALLPLALNFIHILAYGAFVHTLMIYAYVLIFIFTVKLVELASQELICSRVKHWYVFPLAGLLCICLLVHNNICACNVGYHAMQANYERSVNISNRFLARLEAMDDYVPGSTPIAIFGVLSSPLNVAGRYSDYGGRVLTWMYDKLFISTGFLDMYLGCSAVRATDGQVSALKESGKVAAMPVFPAAGSVDIIDGVAVVKLGEDTMYVR